jgi:uncharacterized protein YcbX
MKDDGGPAFPVVTNQYHYGYSKDMPAAVSGGMTLRDYFAAKAMPLSMDRLRENFTRDMGDRWDWDDGDWESIAENAYALADAMLKAREA